MPLQTTPNPSVIKSIQRGSTSLASAGTSDVTINSVDTDKAFVSVSCKSGGKVWRATSTSSEYYTTSVALIAGGTLTSSTNLRVSGGNMTGYTLLRNDVNMTAYWEVIEYV